MGAKPVSLGIKNASVNGVIRTTCSQSKPLLAAFLSKVFLLDCLSHQLTLDILVKKIGAFLLIIKDVTI